MISVKKTLYFLLWMWMLLSCYQIYTIKLFGSYLPLTFFIMIVSIFFIKTNQFKDELYVLTFFYFGLNLVYGLWSTILGLWLYQIFFGFIFIVSYCIFKRIEQPEKIASLLRVFIFSSSINALLIIIFRLSPPIESVFIYEFLSFFKNPDRLDGFNLLNVFDPDKAGGVFDNANTAATFHLICLGLLIMIKKKINKFLYFLIMILNIFAVICSGSKSAVIIMISSCFIIFLISFYYSGRKKDRLTRFLFLFLFVLSTLLSLWASLQYFFATKFGSETVDTSEDRYNLIMFAGSLFKESPLLGLGFGGWQTKINQLGSSYGVLSNWPPHNSIIEAWATTGMFGSLLVILIIAILFYRAFEFVKIIDIQEGKGLIFALIGAVIMPLGDPQPFLGPVQAAAPLGLAFAYCYIMLKLRKQSIK